MNEWGKVIKKLSTLKKIILGIILLLFLAGCFWLYIITSVSANHEFNSQTVDTVLTDLSNKNYELAYDKFADKYKEEESFETFKKGVEPFKDTYVNYEANSFTVTKTTRYILPIDPQTLEYRGQIAFKNGNTKQIKAIFIRENEDWRLYIVDFN